MSTPKPTLIHQLLGNLSPVEGRELPFVSVVTPTWNRPAFLPWLIYMFRYQDYPADRRELIVLDDSECSHQSIIDRLTGGAPEKFNIRYLHHPTRLALGKKRNMLNELATGEYILCMDDDDYYPADKISYTIGMMQRHRALISGSDQIPIWYSHINRIFQTHSFGAKHILNGTFCYHRNYLKKHRYADDAMLAEEVSFTDDYSVTPLQLPGERTILCISHSQNTFDKDYVLGSSTLLDTTLEQQVKDPMLLAWYQSLHNVVRSQPVQWRHVEKVLVINLDTRTDRWQQIQQELTRCGIPEAQWVRISACQDEDGAAGRRASWLSALQLARQNGWRNCLILEDDTVFLKQQKHVSALNAMLNALETLPWQTVILGGRIDAGQAMKNLTGVVHVGSSDRICAMLVNASYYEPMIAQMRSDLSSSVEAQWAPLMQAGKWLGFSPSLCYQRAGYSDIEKQHTDNIQHYFTRINQRVDAGQCGASQLPAANQLGDSIGFFIAAPFHWQVYQPIVSHLLAAGQRCELLINDTVDAGLLREISALLEGITDPRLRGSRLTEARQRKQRYAVLVSTHYHPMLQGLARRHVRAMAGIAEPQWDHAWWNAFYHRILCYAPMSQQALNIAGTACLVGNPRFDALSSPECQTVRRADARPTLIYAPKLDDADNVARWATTLGRLTSQFNLITVMQHGGQYFTPREETVAQVKRSLKKRITDTAQTLAWVRQADIVIGDNRALLFDALHLGKPVIALSGAAVLADEPMPVVSDITQLRHALDTAAPLFTGSQRRHWCDAFLDRQAGARAAEAIVAELNAPDDGNSLLASLQHKLFG
ncbi:glycosyltransferase [Atlantibacter hermannii]|uniref:glycosyltransferase n=1 Tax=Atlantibacter hermannii TaxID=565 RepID=UPI0013EEFA04|nr:glycosyltransferase [Atlantibacter hermannii]